MVNGPCAALLERVGGDRAIFLELCNVFLDDAPKRLELIRTALTTGDAPAVQREAHAFRGAAAAFDAEDVVAAARQLERLAVTGKLADGHYLWKLLESHGRRLIDAVRAGKERG